jgi:phosphotransferase system HPr (HPr) family protein
MKKATATVQDRRGLHLTPSARVVRCAEQFKSQITLCHDCKEANACSLLQILTLGAAFGSEVEIRPKAPTKMKPSSAWSSYSATARAYRHRRGAGSVVVVTYRRASVISAEHIKNRAGEDV